jgi:hypothetical protein
MGRSPKQTPAEAQLIAARNNLVSSLTELRDYFSLASLTKLASTFVTGAAKTTANEASGLVSKLTKIVVNEIGKRF